MAQIWGRCAKNGPNESTWACLDDGKRHPTPELPWKALQDLPRCVVALIVVLPSEVGRLAQSNFHRLGLEADSKVKVCKAHRPALDMDCAFMSS